MPKYVVWVRGTKSVLAEVVVSARDEDEAGDKAAALVERDRRGDIEWQEDGSHVDYDDIDTIEEADEDAELTKVRR